LLKNCSNVRSGHTLFSVVFLRLGSLMSWCLYSFAGWP
jgi:hypothetical protein